MQRRQVFARISSLIAAAVLMLAVAPHELRAQSYRWHEAAQRPQTDTLAGRIAPPAGFVRRPAPAASFAAWLRGLPLRPDGEPVRLFNGGVKSRNVHVAVVDIDIGRRDLQQCADAIMRLRAEWQLASGRTREIGFNYTGGGRVSYARWATGERPSDDGKHWRRSAKPDTSYAAFRRYMDNVFAFAGTYSLERELKPVPVAELAIGDVFIKGGFPGHAVLIADVVENPATGERRFLLLQSFMPAQSIHVLKNPTSDGTPWYEAAVRWPLVTPEWTFPAGSLKRWP